MGRAVRIAAGLGLAGLACGGAWPAKAQYYPPAYPYYYPRPVYPPPYYPPPPVYAPPPYAPPVYAPAPPQPSASLAEVQRLLAQLGYDPGPIDGLSGPRLSEAVLAFQRDHEQSPTGRLTGETIGAIREAARTRDTRSVPPPVMDRPPIDSPSFTTNPANRPTLNVKP